VLLQHINCGKKTQCLQLLPLPDDCISGGKRQHDVVQAALMDLLNKQCK
jgi:hypothetical protein